MKIRNHDHYQACLKLLESLIDKEPEIGTLECMQVTYISSMLEKWESARYFLEKPTIQQAIKFRMQEMGLKQKDLCPFIGGSSKVSEVLAGKIGLTVAMIKKLHLGLNIPLEILVGLEECQKKS